MRYAMIHYMEKICTSQEETQALAHEITSSLRKDDTHATILALKGDLGSGKTTFTKYIAEALGIKDVITSPTFVIQKIYDLEDQSFDRLIHIDAYRLSGGEEMEALGWGSLIKDGSNLIVIEWPENVADVLPRTAHTIEFETIDETSRNISYE